MKINAKIMSFWEWGGSNEPALRSLNPCWGPPGAQGAPGPPQKRPRYRPGSQKLQKSMKNLSKSIENHWKIMETSSKLNSTRCETSDDSLERDGPKGHGGGVAERHWIIKQDYKACQNRQTNCRRLQILERVLLGGKVNKHLRR